MKKIILFCILLFSSALYADTLYIQNIGFEFEYNEVLPNLNQSLFVENISFEYEDKPIRGMSIGLMSFEFEYNAILPNLNQRLYTSNIGFEFEYIEGVAYYFNFNLLRSVNSIIREINQQMEITAFNKNQVIKAVNEKENINTTSWHQLLAYLKTNYGKESE